MPVAFEVLVPLFAFVADMNYYLIRGAYLMKCLVIVLDHVLVVSHLLFKKEVSIRVRLTCIAAVRSFLLTKLLRGVDFV